MAEGIQLRLTHTGAISSKRIKLHTNRTEINKDGLIEFFGVAQPPFGNIAIAFIQVDGIKWRV